MIYEESIAVVEKSSSLLAFNSLPNDFENFTSYGSLTLPERVSCYQQSKKKSENNILLYRYKYYCINCINNIHN